MKSSSQYRYPSMLMLTVHDIFHGIANIMGKIKVSNRNNLYIHCLLITYPNGPQQVLIPAYLGTAESIESRARRLPATPRGTALPLARMVMRARIQRRSSFEGHEWDDIQARGSTAGGMSDRRHAA
jgi:hypothetical protein